MTDRTFHRWVAVGDSFTEGVQDVTRADGTFVGWADRTAAALADASPWVFRYANVAVRGKLLDQVVVDQFPYAELYDADLVSFHAGGNDALRSSVEIDDLVARWHDALASLVVPGRTVLVFTVLERSGEPVGPTAGFTERLAARIARFNDGVREGAARHDGVVLLDLAAVPALRDRRFWHADRLHLNPDGHALVAQAATAVLTRGEGAWEPPPAEPWIPSPARGLAQDARWAARHLAPWAVRRLRGISSGDDRLGKRMILAPVEHGFAP